MLTSSNNPMEAVNYMRDLTWDNSPLGQSNQREIGPSMDRTFDRKSPEMTHYFSVWNGNYGSGVCCAHLPCSPLAYKQIGKSHWNHFGRQDSSIVQSWRWTLSHHLREFLKVARGSYRRATLCSSGVCFTFVCTLWALTGANLSKPHIVMFSRCPFVRC